MGPPRTVPAFTSRVRVEVAGVVGGERKVWGGLEGGQTTKGTKTTKGAADEPVRRPTPGSRERVPSGVSTHRRRGAETQRGGKAGGVVSFVVDRETGRDGRQPRNAKARRRQGAKGGSGRGVSSEGGGRRVLALKAGLTAEGAEGTEDGSGQTTHASWNRFLAPRRKDAKNCMGWMTTNSRVGSPAVSSRPLR